MLPAVVWLLVESSDCGKELLRRHCAGKSTVMMDRLTQAFKIFDLPYGSSWDFYFISPFLYSEFFNLIKNL